MMRSRRLPRRAQAQYENTQGTLKKLGIKELHLVRGMKIKQAEVQDVRLKLQPASSFSSTFKTARMFAGSFGTLYMVKVPASQVLGSFATGFGCLNEEEIVLLGHERINAIAIPISQGSTAASAVASAKKMRKEKAASAKAKNVTESTT